MAWPGASLAVLAGNRFATLGLNNQFAISNPLIRDSKVVAVGRLRNTGNGGHAH